jgi:hypothetical protein
MRAYTRLLVVLMLVCVLTVFPSGATETPTVEGDFPPLTFQPIKPVFKSETKRIHPSIRLLDQNGKSVVESAAPLSLISTCGVCHDTAYITKNNYHAQVGSDEMNAPGESRSGRSWDIGPGMFGRWNPLTYRILSIQGSDRLDMGTADWLMTMGSRHVGGGPAMFSRYSEKRLSELVPSDPVDPETHIIDPVSGMPRAWSWKASGGMELNCFMCHLKNPNNIERTAAIKKGWFQWASTATLVGSGLVEWDGQVYRWLTGEFKSDGSVAPSTLRISEPNSDNCRLCHAKSCRCTDPVVFENSLENWAAETSGEIFSPQRMFDSGMNLKDKVSLSRPWDTHAQRLLGCIHCHYSMNNPRYNEKELATVKPRHLRFDPRGLNNNEYLLRPDHNLAKGHSAQGTVARRLDGSMRNCRDCHNAMESHDFLPYKSVHFEKLSCPACHIPKVYAPARRVTDWTIINPNANPMVEHRGVQGPINDSASLIDGYLPALLFHEESDDRFRLGPSNIIVSWFWVEGSPERPVRLVDLKTAFLTADGAYHPKILDALDTDKSGNLSATELRLDTNRKVAAATQRLRQVGVVNPRIKGEIQPYTHSHGIAAGDFVMQNCSSCHSKKSRINEEIELASYVPGNVMPEPVKDSHTKLIGILHMTPDAKLAFRPNLDPKELYIHGTLRPQWLDIIGMLIVAGSIGGVGFHGALRITAARRRKKK